MHMAECADICIGSFVIPFFWLMKCPPICSVCMNVEAKVKIPGQFFSKFNFYLVSHHFKYNLAAMYYNVFVLRYV